MFATGCGDHTCILWDCQTLTPLVTLRNQRHWVITVILAQEDDGRTSTLLTMSKEVIHVYSYQSRKEAAEMVEPKMRISVKSESDYSELRDVFFTPGIAYKNGRVTFIKQMALFETQTIGDADIVSVDVRSGKVLSTIHINQKIRKLLGAGQRFALLLLPFVDNNYKNLAVVDLREGRIIGGGVVPHTR